MTKPVSDSQDGGCLDELRGCAKLLVSKLESDDFDGASRIIKDINNVKNNEIYQTVGRLTRGLHNSIVNFNLDVDPADPGKGGDASEMKEANDRLQYVINLTHQAANKTMDMVEDAVPVAKHMGEKAETLLNGWQRFGRREMDADEFRNLYQSIEKFLVDMREDTGVINKSLQDILLEQGYQDLTGQVLQKVSSMIREVENELVGLMKMAGQVEEVTGVNQNDQGGKNHGKRKTASPVEVEGPQIDAKNRDDVVSNQDDVDDLLSSLGF